MTIGEISRVSDHKALSTDGPLEHLKPQSKITLSVQAAFQALDPVIKNFFAESIRSLPSPSDTTCISLSLTKSITNTIGFEKHLLTLAKTPNLTLSLEAHADVIEPLLQALSKHTSLAIKELILTTNEKKPPSRLFANRLMEFIQGLKNLEVLDLSHCKGLSKPNFLRLLTAPGETIHTLILTNHAELSDTDLAELGNRPYQLTTLSLSGCKELSEETICELVSKIGQNLTHLDLAHCQLSTKLLYNLPLTLVHLGLKESTQSYETIATLLQKYPHLKTLEIAYPTNFGSLKVLSLDKLICFLSPVTVEMPAEHSQYICSRLLKGPPLPDDALARKINSWAAHFQLTEINQLCQKLFKVTLLDPPTKPPSSLPLVPTQMPTPEPIIASHINEPAQSPSVPLNQAAALDSTPCEVCSIEPAQKEQVPAQEIAEAYWEPSQALIASYLTQLEILELPLRIQIINWAMRHKQFEVLDTCFEQFNEESPCAFVVEEDLSLVKLLVVGLKLDSPKWQEALEILQGLLIEGQFQGKIALEVDSQALTPETSARSLLQKIAKIAGQYIESLKGQEPSVEMPVAAHHFFSFAAHLPMLRSLELISVEITEADLSLIVQLESTLEKFRIYDYLISDTVKEKLSICSQKIHLIGAFSEKRPQLPQPLEELVFLEEEKEAQLPPELFTLLYAQHALDDKQKLLVEVAKAPSIPLDLLSELFSLSEQYAILFAPCSGWFNQHLFPWIKYTPETNEVLITFAKGSIPLWLSHTNFKSVIALLDFLVSKRQCTFRCVYFDAYDPLESETFQAILNVIYPNTSSCTFINFATESWKGELSKLPTVQEVSFAECQVTYADVAKVSASCRSVHYDTISELGITDYLSDKELELLIQLLVKEQKTKLLQTLRFSSVIELLFSSIPEVECFAHAYFNTAFGAYVTLINQTCLQFFPFVKPQAVNQEALKEALRLLAQKSQNLSLLLEDEALTTNKIADIKHLIMPIAGAVTTVRLRNPEAIGYYHSQTNSPYTADKAIETLSVCPNLVSLQVENSDLQGVTLSLLAVNCKKLTTVGFTNCPALQLPKLRGLLEGCNTRPLYLGLAHNQRLDDERLAMVVKGLPLHTLDLTGCIGLTDATLQTLSTLKNLQALTLSGCTNLTLMTQVKFEKLEKVHLTLCKKITNKGLELFLMHNRQLSSINLSENTFVDSATVQLLAKYLLQVRELTLSSCYKLTSEALWDLATLWPESLELLDIEFNPHIDEAILKSIIYLNSRLASINVSGSPKIAESLATLLSITTSPLTESLPPVKRVTNSGLKILTHRYPNVRSFTLEHSPEVGQYEFEEALRRWENLQTLNVTGLPLLSDYTVEGIFTNATKLQQLTLGACRHLTDRSLATIAKRGAKLKTLHLLDGPNFTDGALIALLLCVRDLHTLTVNDCPLITLVSLPELPLILSVHTLNFARCENLTPDGLLQFLQHCPYLKTLTLTGCNKISASTIELLKDSHKRLEQIVSY